MPQRTKTLFATLFVVCAAALLFWSVRRTKIADEAALSLIPAREAQNAIDFTLPVVAADRDFHLNDQAKAGPVVLDFWATWCGPCREELPHLEKLSQKYQGRIAFYGVNSSDSDPQITTFTKQNRLTFPMLSDAKQKVASLYGADAIPLTVVVDTDGKVRAVINGYDSSVSADLTKMLDSLLAEQRKTL